MGLPFSRAIDANRVLFNSYEFVLLFLPLAFALFWYGGKSLRWRLGLLTFASYAFYSWWQFGSWGEFAAVYLLAGLAESMTAWLRGDLAITRDELIERSTDLFVLVGDHVVRQE